MEYSIEIMMAISFGVMGFSMLFNAADWDKWINHLLNQGRNTSLALGSINVLLGSFIIAFHWIWEDIFTIVTLFGVLFLFRGAVLLLWPGCLLLIWEKVTPHFNTLIKISGFIILLIAMVLSFYLYGYGE